MDIYMDQIDNMVYEMKKLLEDYTREYCLANNSDAEARLIRCRNHGKDTYYRAHREDGRYVRKSISGDKNAISELARKEYLRNVISVLKKNITILEDSRKKLEELSFDAIQALMNKACKELPEEYCFLNGTGRMRVLPGSNEDRFRIHRAWASEPYEQSNYMPERRKYPTSGGFKVRSKSEQHIAEQLINYGVPFRYEQIIRIGDISYSADFTFRDSNMEPFYWEHAGMMNVQKYVDGYYRKMNAFDSAGIVPWKNLIISYDIEETINIPMIKSIIENDVIPRM